MLRETLILLPGFLILIILTLSFHTFTANNLSNILLSPASAQSIVTDKIERFQNETAAAAEGTTDTGLIVKLLADNLETSFNKSAAILEITSKLPQVNSTLYATSIDPELHGIPQDLDTPKRKVAQDILKADKDFEVIFFLMPNGDMYIEEPYSRQQNLTRDNFAFRDYYKGAVNTGNTYLGNVIISASSGLPQANIAVPIFSEDNRPASNTTLTGIWAGGLNLTPFNESLQALNIPDGLRIIYVDQFGQKIADSDKSSSLLLNKNGNESFANLQSFRNAVEEGKSGSRIETINHNKVLIFYEPVKFNSTTWAVLLIKPYNNENTTSAMTDSTKAMTEPSSAAVAVFGKDSRPFGLTYGDWTAKWWQWAYSIPKDIHPAYDDTGKYCTVNQNGPVWFFPGTYGKPVVRECTVSEGKAILLPILNSECSFAEFPDLKTIQELRICAKTFQDQVTQLQASVDGADIPESELRKYRIQSPTFNFTLPKDNILGLPINTTTQAVADGNWVFLKPLSVGMHKISFKGNTANSNATNSTGANTTAANAIITTTTSTSNDGNSFAFPSGWNFETTYRITVTSSK